MKKKIEISRTYARIHARQMGMTFREVCKWLT